MNIGQKIQELRKQKRIKQEDLAAELGVTAAAVSKWENGYTLPDILMLCALADFFGVTTDELLGRSGQKFNTVIVANTSPLAQKIQEMAAGFGILTKGIYTAFPDAVEAVRGDEQITHLLLGHLGADAPPVDLGLFSGNQGSDQERKLLFYAQVSDNEAEILSELEHCLK